MSYQHFNNTVAMEYAAQEAFKAMDGLGMNLIESSEDSPFWYRASSLKVRFKHEEAKAGDFFWDGNNGDKHEVIAVDHANQRIAWRNCDQNEELLEIGGY